MSYMFSQTVNALQLGSIYALVALGYSMVYGIILLLNFAHGDIIMVGAYVTYYAMTSFHLHPLVSVVLAVVMSTLLGVVIEKVAYTPLRSAPRLSLLITAIGISFLLENGAQLLFGTDTKSMAQDPLIPGTLTVGGVSITYAALITILVSVVSMVALTLLVQRTKLGKAMRAVSEDMGAAQLMGISLNRTISFTFAVGSALAGIGAIGILFTAGRESRSPIKRFLKGLYGLYGVSSYLSDILSYSRLLALGLATSVISTVFNQLGAMLGGGVVGAVFFILIFLIGHAMNMAINLLGAYVHTNRLQFVEFFGKFYEGGGRKFQPFAANTKHFKIMEEK